MTNTISDYFEKKKNVHQKSWIREINNDIETKLSNYSQNVIKILGNIILILVSIKCSTCIISLNPDVRSGI